MSVVAIAFVSDMHCNTYVMYVFVVYIHMVITRNMYTY